MYGEIICLTLMLITAYLIYQLHRSDTYISELEAENDELRMLCKHHRWSGTDRAVMRE